MAVGIFELFNIGIGPSSSHTVGPMRAALRFAHRLEQEGRLDDVARLQVRFYGSLAATGKGHGSDRAVLMGLEGQTPEAIVPDDIEPRVEAILETRRVHLLGRRELPFDPEADLQFRKGKRLPFHSNGMIFEAYDAAGEPLLERTYYSVGGGFVVAAADAEQDRLGPEQTPRPYPFHSAAELLELGRRHGLRIDEIALANETERRSPPEVRAELLHIRDVMRQVIERGCTQTGVLPGGLRVQRRAAEMAERLRERTDADTGADGLEPLDWAGVYAIAVNEENAAGSRVVTAPTNGAAGIVPAVLRYYEQFVAGADDDGAVRFLATAGAIGILYKENASISGAEVGCQGEVGVACSMAAAGLVSACGGTNEQIENAAEIGMEHNLGLTCDPIGGLVQIPCIERNAVGATKAIAAARMALRGNGSHRVSLDKVIATMRRTGRDMKTKYKETSRGGLALNVIEC